MIAIPHRLQLYLSDQPEYGMGYQYVIAKLSTGNLERGFILNGATFVKPGEFGTMTPKDIAQAEAAALKSRLSISEVTLIPRPPETLRDVRHITRYSGQKSAQLEAISGTVLTSRGAKDSPITTTLDGEVFKRFSAYVNDFRITEKRGLKPGTFATTAEDAQNVHTGREAVARYALENKQSANKRFTITPQAEERLRQGVVQPAYGEPGGGVEVIFVDGTRDNSVSEPDILPE